MFSEIIFIGRLTRALELRHLPNGTPIANFAVAVDRPFMNQQGQKEMDFIDCAAWSNPNHLQTGR